MIIKISRDDLYTGVSFLQNVTTKKTTIAILYNILIETDFDSIILTATDLEVGIKIKVPAEVLTPGSITLPAKKLFEILRETSEDIIKMELSENNWVKMLTTSGNYRLAGIDSEEYPKFPEFSEDILTTIPSENLKNIIEKTYFAISTETETQFNLIGALFEKETREEKNYIKFVSSDGHRLLLMEKEVDTDISKMNYEKPILIPRKGVLEMRKFCEKSEFIEIGFDEKQAVLKNEDSLMIIRLLNGDFPKYETILNAINREKFIEIDKNEFILALKRINLFSDDEFSSIKFTLSENLLSLSSKDMDIGSGIEKLKISYIGEEMDIGFNARYFIESLQVMQSKKIKCYLSSKDTPFLIEGDEDPGYVSVIMPMTI
jgi:DNA polymerase-3 subunit beta